MMGFTANQLRQLKRELSPCHIRTRFRDGRELAFIGGWYAISEANRIFGHAGWDRETVEVRNVLTRESRGTFLAVYLARVRVTVRANGQLVVREGLGSGEGKGGSPGEAHDLAFKASETDATKRALATFGRPFGLGLYLSKAPAQKSAENGLADAKHPEPIGIHAPVAAAANPTIAGPIDKSVLSIGSPRRYRDKEHLKFVASQPCLICNRTPADAHHLRFAQQQAIGRKVSDEYTVPLCRVHHRQVHQRGNEVTFWADLGIDALEIARGLWQESRSVGFTPANSNDHDQSVSDVPVSQSSVRPNGPRAEK